MIYKEGNSSFLIQKRKSTLIAIVLTAIGCILFYTQDAWAAADTAALNHEISTLWKAQQTTQPDSMIAQLALLTEKCKAAGYHNGVARSMLYTALTYGQTGNFEGCRKFSHMGIPWCDTSLAGKKLLNFLYNQLANCDHKEGLYTTAIGWYYKALLIAIQSEEPSSLVRTNTNIGVLMNDVGKPQSALYYLQQAEQMARKENMKGVELGNALVNKAIAYDYMKQHDSCMNTYLGAIDIARKTNNNNLLIISLYGVGNAYLDMKQPEKALYYGNMAVQLTSNGDDIYNSMFAYYVVGNAHYWLHHYDSALYYLQKFMDIAQNLNLIRYESEASKSIGRIYYESGEMAKATPYLAQYITWQDSLMNVETLQQTTEMQVRFRTADQEKKLIQKELLLARQENDIRQKNTLIMVICSLLLLAVSVIYVRYRYLRRHQAERLRQAKHRQQMAQLRAMIEGEEKERRRIARELHDDIGGLLTIARIRFDTLKKEEGNSVHQNDLEVIGQLLDKASYGIRSTAHRLLPDIIMRHKLPEIMRLMAEPIQHAGQIDITIQHMGDFDSFEDDTDLKLNIYRIVQELVSNILKHAQATEAVIELRHMNDLLEITVEDNGKGYDLAGQPAGIGLENVKMRVNYLGGEISITSEAGTGTSVYIHLDFTVTPKNNTIPNAHPGIHSR